MTIKMTLLTAVAVIALPGAMAGAQTNPPAGATPQPTTGAVTPPASDATPTPTTNNATEDAQDAAAQPAPATAPDPVNENAEPATTTTQAQATPPQQPAATAPAPAAQAQTSAQAQTPAPAAAAGPTVLATAADITTGSTVVDQAGGSVGTIESVDATGAVVATGSIRAKLPLTSFGRNNRGLVISMTRAQLEAAARQATPTPS